MSPEQKSLESYNNNVYNIHDLTIETATIHTEWHSLLLSERTVHFAHQIVDIVALAFNTMDW